MAFVESTYAEGTPRVDPQTGAVVGGRNTSKPQRSAERFIPDLQSIFQGDCPSDHSPDHRRPGHEYYP